jgi:hypothetical protein
MSKILGKDVIERKKSLAELVVSHLTDLGHQAKIIKNRTNSKEHTDRLLVESSIGLVHITALSSKDPNEKIPYQNNDQRWLADKEYVAVGWNTKDNRTFVFFIKSDDMLGRFDLSKTDLNALRNREYSKVFV